MEKKQKTLPFSPPANFSCFKLPDCVVCHFTQGKALEVEIFQCRTKTEGKKMEKIHDITMYIEIQ